ncbi:thioredoxin-like domain-containing protein [uncultured Lutibacter sp.]|mgnify:CR=1 FL=1|uniref:TlpA family protein disulfide reductase n=1 Tax=uncultured Lutibacter sp. TaxID=437739 RepID=UPI00262144D5|nr:thioredoxin-like domain-containing protein [uncultured Lutibacter sp.]
MLKKILFVIVLISYTVQSQTYVKGILDPAQNFSWIVLYQLKGAKQLYVKNVTIKDGEFSIDFPENATKGMYRLMYSQQNGGFVDFIYNNENIEVKFNPESPSDTVEFLTSEENIQYAKYLFEMANWRQELDGHQISFFNIEDENERTELQNKYLNSLKYFKDFQTKFEENTEGKLANNFIKSSKIYYAPSLIKTPQEYLNSVKKHFFDFINFEDEELMNSTFISEKVTDYVFYLNGSEDAEVQIVLYKNAVNEVLIKMQNVNFQNEILTTLLYNFAQLENTILIDFIIEEYYNKLPEDLKNKQMIQDIQEKVKLAVGKLTPEITWQENGITKNLSELDIAENYIVVFWSTGCSHCLVEIPQLYEFTKDKSDIHVLSFSLENDDIEFNKHTLNFTKWTTILGLNKWENPIAKSYQITSTPTYFVLDKNKKIIAKPNYFEDVKAFFKADE